MQQIYDLNFQTVYLQLKAKREDGYTLLRKLSRIVIHIPQLGNQTQTKWHAPRSFYGLQMCRTPQKSNYGINSVWVMKENKHDME